MKTLNNDEGQDVKAHTGVIENLKKVICDVKVTSCREIWRNVHIELQDPDQSDEV
jgi:hypothetical protein